MQASSEFSSAIYATNLLNRLTQPGNSGSSQSGSPLDEPSKKSAKRTTSGNRVLMFGRIRELALYRAAVLRDRGFDVVTPQTREEAIANIRNGNFDVAVLTYTLSNDIVQELSELVREYCPDCPLIAISNSKRSDRVVGPDYMVNADEGPAALIAALRRVTRQN